MLKEERRLEIARLLAENKVVRVADLSARFQVTTTTIRRDLQKLTQEGRLKRTYGGATALELEHVRNFQEAKAVPLLEVKRRIGRAAAALVGEGDTISLQAGSTTLQVARSLKGRRGITVLTNDLDIAWELAQSSGITVNLTGGILREGSRILVGPLAEQTVAQVHVDKAILGVTAVSLQEGLTNLDLLDAQIKKAMIQAADEVIVVADHTKFGKVHFARVASLSAIQKLVADDGIAPADLAALRARGIEVIVC
jgi:DeoR/GlpR family transcriptional regulator of sugar metabolism